MGTLLEFLVAGGPNHPVEQYAKARGLPNDGAW